MNRLAAILVFSTITFTSSKALADSNFFGLASDIVSFTTGSDNASLYAGFVRVTSGNTFRDLYWGGSNCSNIVPITATQFQILSDIVINKKNIVAFYKQQGSSLCITGFALSGTTTTTTQSPAQRLFPGGPRWHQSGCFILPGLWKAIASSPRYRKTRQSLVRF